MRNKDKSQHYCFPTPFLFQVQSHFIPDPLSGAAGMGNGRLWSVLNSSFLLLLPPHIFPLLQLGSFPCTAVLQDKPAPAWGPPWAAVWVSPPPWSPHRLLGNPCSRPWTTSSTHFSSDLGVSRAVPHTFPRTLPHPLSSPPGSVLPAFKHVSSEAPQLCPALGRLQNQLEPAGTSPGQPRAPLTETPCSLYCQRLARTPNTYYSSIFVNGSLARITY